MKGTEQFKDTIKSYLDTLALVDELFREKYESTTRTIDDIVNYILCSVEESGCIGFSDDEIYSMALHVIDEPDIEIGKPSDCYIVSNHHVELTPEEILEQKNIALRKFQQEELDKLRERNNKKKSSSAKTSNNIQPSLFD